MNNYHKTPEFLILVTHSKCWQVSWYMYHVLAYILLNLWCQLTISVLAWCLWEFIEHEALNVKHEAQARRELRQK